MSSRAHFTSHRVIDTLKSQLDSYESMTCQNIRDMVDHTTYQYNEALIMVNRLEQQLIQAQIELDRARRDYTICMDRRENSDSENPPSCRFERQRLDRAEQEVDTIQRYMHEADSYLNIMRGQCSSFKSSAAQYQSSLSMMVADAKNELNGVGSDVDSYNRAKATYTPPVNVGTVGIGSFGRAANSSGSVGAASGKVESSSKKAATAKHLMEIPQNLSSSYGVVNKMVSSDITTNQGKKVARVILSSSDSGVVSFSPDTKIEAKLIGDIETIMLHNGITTLDAWFDSGSIPLAQSVGYRSTKSDTTSSRGATLVKKLGD